MLLKVNMYRNFQTTLVLFSLLRLVQYLVEIFQYVESQLN